MNFRKDSIRAEILAAPILPTLFKLALPTVSVILAQTFVNIAEAYYLGFLGTASMAGVALVFPLFMLMMTMSAGGIGSGVSSAVARAVGAGHQRDADALLFHALAIAFALGAIFTLTLLFGGVSIYQALGGRADSLDAALRYSNYLFAASIPLWVVNLVAAALRGSGNVRVPATVTFIGACVIVVVSPALIFGFGPIPAMGIAGAGLAFLGYYACATTALLLYMATGRSGLQLRAVPLQWRHFSQILKVGLPAALSTLQTNLTVILITAAVGLLGTNALAAYGIASRLDYLIIPILFGISSAVLTMVGINMGAGQIRRAKRIAWVGALLGAGVTQAIGLFAALFPMVWIHLFSLDPAVTGPAQSYLQIVAPFYGVYGLSFVITFAAQGAAHVLWPFLAVSVRLLIAAGIGWIAVRFLGGDMTILSFIVAASFIASALTCSVAMFSRRVWKLESI